MEAAINKKDKSGDPTPKTIDPVLDRKLDEITAGARPYLKHHLLTKITIDNVRTIVSYIYATMTESNPRESYRIVMVQVLKQLAEFHHPKSFRDLTRDDIIAFLDRLRKPESIDPLHKWIGTYENNRMSLLKFFKWLHAPPNTRTSERPIPAVFQNIDELKRKEVSMYKPTELWTEEDDLLFCKYVKSKRDKAYHIVARDTCARPQALMDAKIRDIVWMNTDNYQVAQLSVNDKTGQRILALTRSAPYLKDWLANGHPWPKVLDAPIFCGEGRKNHGRKMRRQTLNTIYRHYQYEYFPKLLEDPNVPPEDKTKIRNLLENRRWNPYVRRHTELTEMSKRVPTHVLNQYAGWSPNSKMSNKYIHYFGNEAFNAVLASQGLTLLSGDGVSPAKKKDILKPRICFNCQEPNKSDAEICTKCRYILDTTIYLKKEEEVSQLKKELEELKSKQKK